MEGYAAVSLHLGILFKIGDTVIRQKTKVANMDVIGIVQVEVAIGWPHRSKMR